MPVISFDRKDFCKLVGKNYSKEKLEELLPMLGMEWEGSEGDEITVEVFPNRPDLLSVEGLARAFRSFVGLRKGLMHYKVKESNYELHVNKTVKAVRPIVAAAVVKGVKLTSEGIRSLMQLQEKLHITHARNRAKAAIGVHDLRAVKFPVTYAAVDPQSVKFIPLDGSRMMTPEEILAEHPKGIKYAHLINKFTAYPMIIGADNEVLSFPPIINSELTKLRPKTKDLFIDVTGTCEFTVNKALNIVTTSLIERGAKACSVLIHDGLSKKHTPNYDVETMDLNVSYCNSLLGVDFSPKRVAGLLANMGFDAKIKEDTLNVSIPCYRTDILHPIDLVEEVAIAYGYMNFKAELPQINTIGKELPVEAAANFIRDFLIGNGFIEVINWDLINEDVLFKKMNAKKRPIVKLLNPKTSEYSVVRDYLTPVILNYYSQNKHNDYPQNIFEIGRVMKLDQNESTGVLEELNLCFATAHSTSNYSEVKGVLDNLMKALKIKYSLKEVSNSSFIEGRVAEIFVNKEAVGFIGEISPEVLINFDLKIPITICEINLSKIL